MTSKNPLHVDNGSLEYTILSVNMEKEKGMRHKNQHISSPRSRSFWPTLLEYHQNKKKNFFMCEYCVTKNKFATQFFVTKRQESK